MRLAREMGEAIGALIGRAIIMSLNVWFWLSRLQRVSETSQFLLQKMQQLFFFVDSLRKALDVNACPAEAALISVSNRTARARQDAGGAMPSLNHSSRVCGVIRSRPARGSKRK